MRPPKYGKPDCPRCVYVGGWDEGTTFGSGYDVYYCPNCVYAGGREVIVYLFDRNEYGTDHCWNPVSAQLAWTPARSPFCWDGWGKGLLLCAAFIDKRRLDEAFSGGKS
jgi:hypothetical protein